jgi:hypothetical protein
MPKCVKCGEIFPPQLMKDIQEVAITIKKCIFCIIDKDEITLPADEKGKLRKYTREEAKKDYLMYLRKLKESLKTNEDLKKYLKGELIDDNEMLGDKKQR